MTLEDIIQKRIDEAKSLDDLAFILKNLIVSHRIGEDGRLLTIFIEVDRIDGLKIEIRPKEHAPPHFHVKANGIDASFSIEGFKLIRGKIDSSKYKMVEWWYEKSRSKLIKFWNDSRPSDCPVGPIKIN